MNEIENKKKDVNRDGVLRCLSTLDACEYWDSFREHPGIYCNALFALNLLESLYANPFFPRFFDVCVRFLELQNRVLSL